MKKLIPIIIALALTAPAMAQDPNFSQFFASPLTMNPALTGKFDGQLRVAGNYRNQWPTINNAFTTFTTSVDFGILNGRIPETDQFGIGFMGFSDRSGNGVLQNTYYSFSTAYHKGLDEDAMHQVGAGFQATYVNKRLNVNGLHFEDMLRSDGFTGVTTESFNSSNLNVSYLDVNAGFLYNGTTNGDNNIYAGVSLYHINNPKESFNEGGYQMARRLTIQAGTRLPVGAVNAVHISGNHSMQAGARNTSIGAAYEINLNDNADRPTSLYLGTWYRLQDAFIPYLGLEFGEFRIGASYDVNSSGLRPGTNMRGGTELSLIYIRQPRDRTLRKLNCPTF